MQHLLENNRVREDDVDRFKGHLPYADSIKRLRVNGAVVHVNGAVGPTRPSGREPLRRRARREGRG
jgi:hypothetical protein